MKKLLTLLLVTLFAVTALTCLMGITASAETYGDLTYSVSNGKVTITDCDTNASGSLTIPSTIDGYPVTSIGNYAFGGCSSLTSITIPYGVTSIGKYSFYNCSSLRSITIPDSVTSIGNYAFDNTAYYNNSSNWENNVLYIGNHLIKAKNSLSGNYNIKAGTKTIGGFAFENCSGLTEITIPDSVEYIGDNAFYGTAIYDNLEYVDGAAYLGKHLIKVKFIVSGDFVVKEGTKTITSNAFEECAKITTVNIPDSVTSIGYRAFYGCSGLTSVTVPAGIISIGESAFYNCSRLKAVYITDLFAWCNIYFEYHNAPSSTYASNPLYYAHNLYLNGELITDLVIPEGITSIKNYAFYGCNSLSSVSICNDVTSVGERAFGSCTNLKEVTIGDGVKSISRWAFEGCNRLNMITLPFVGASVDGTENTHFGYIFGAWSFNYNSSCVPSSLKYITVTKAKTVDKYAFSECKNIEVIMLPDTLTSIGEGAFFDCNSLSAVIYMGTEEQWQNVTVDTLGNEILDSTLLFANGTAYTGWITMGEDKFYLKDNEIQTNCWIEDQYLGFDGKLVKSQWVGEYYVDENGNKVTNAWVGDKYLGADGKVTTPPISDGWVQENGNWVFYENGVKLTNTWKEDSVGWCYLTEDGTMATNEWIQDSAGWCYVGSDGYCLTDCWMQDSVGWCYLNSEGRMATNTWILDSVGWCYVGSDGYCVTDCWMADSVGWVYLDSEGRMKTNAWVMDSVGWCYVGSDGYAVTNCWVADSSGWCYLDSNGRMVTNDYVYDSNGKCWLDADGYWDGIYR